MAAHIPPNQRPPYWTPSEHVKEEKNPLWPDILKYTLITAVIIIAAWLVLNTLGIIFNDLGEWMMNPIQYFNNLFRRARFIPPNKEFGTLGAWTVFVCIVITCIKSAIYRRNNRD
jgi:hypothetical protein